MIADFIRSLETLVEAVKVWSQDAQIKSIQNQIHICLLTGMTPVGLTWQPDTWQQYNAFRIYITWE